MLPLPSSFLLFLSFCLPHLPTSFATAAADCNQTCGAYRAPYPFGFSPGCKIPLNCSSSGTDGPQIRIGRFQVKSFTSESILVNVSQSCERPISDAYAFFSKSYSMTVRNTLLARNCSPSFTYDSRCVDMLSQGFHPPSCGNFSCIYYRQDNQSERLVNKSWLTGNGCSMLSSSMAIFSDQSPLASVDFETVELGWWVTGECNLCVSHGRCKNVSVLGRALGVTCSCPVEFTGDGFKDGSGCEKASSKCNPSRYMSGSCGGTSRVGILIGGIFAGAAAVAVLAIACYFIKRRSTFLRTQKSTKRLLSEVACTVPLYNYKEIEKATGDFSEKNRLGTGAYGTVYVGKLHNGGFVAVKKLRDHDTDSTEQVMNEIKLLSSVSHPNLVRLLGCCIDRDERILVYEFMPNGTLSQHLQRERGRGLPWTVRLNIATETAKAIAHLHSAIHPPIYHRDIKSSNILLDFNFNTKVADFGLSRMIITECSHISTAPQGTPGYVDPQYHQNFHLSDKSDVYSFGVVLVEIITALKVVDFSRGQSEVNLAALAISKIGKGCVEDIIDPFLEPHRDAWTLSSIHKVAELAFRCLAFHRDMRPSMLEVADELEQIRLSGWAPADNIFMSTSSSIRSSPSNVTDKSRVVSKSRRLICIHSKEDLKGDSPISVQDPWLSEQNSPSANSLLGNTVR